MYRVLILLVILITLAGCSASPSARDIRVDATSDKTFQRSFARLNNALSDKQQQQLMFAVLKINLEGVETAKELLQRENELSLSAIAIKDRLHGLNYQGIIELSQSVQSVEVRLEGDEPSPGLTAEFSAPLASMPAMQDATLADTAWLLTTNSNGHIRQNYILFNSDGRLSYLDPAKKSPGPHAWQQKDKKVRFTFNDNYAVYLGEITGENVITGKAANVNGFNWTWQAERVVN